MVSKISGLDVKEHQFEKKFLVFPDSKVTSFSFSCELSLQTSNCGISSLIVCCCWESCCCCCCYWKELFTALVLDCNSGHLSCHSLKKDFLWSFWFCHAEVISWDLLLSFAACLRLPPRRKTNGFLFLFLLMWSVALAHKVQENLLQLCSSDFFFWKILSKHCWKGYLCWGMT